MDIRQKASRCRTMKLHQEAFIMQKRKYTKIQVLEPQILEMKRLGRTNREIAETLGLERSQIKNWISRHNRSEKQKAQGILPKPRGRKKMTEVERLRMENELLRLFLKEVERM